MRHWSTPCRVLEVGSGSGYVITSVQRLLAEQGICSQCWATDINPAAAAASLQTVEQHQVRLLAAMASVLPSPLIDSSEWLSLCCLCQCQARGQRSCCNSSL